MAIHKIKSWPRLFQATLEGSKKHDLRKASDRDYQVGDTVILQEYIPETETYTGRELKTKITYATSADNPCALSNNGLKEDFVILSLEVEIV